MKLRADAIIDPELSFHFAFAHSMKVTSEPHDHDFFEFFIIYENPANHFINGLKQRLDVGSLVFIRPADQHYFEKTASDEFHLLNVAFSRDTFESMCVYLDSPAFIRTLLQGALPPVVPLLPTEMQSLKDIFEELAYSPGADKTSIRQQFKLQLMHVFVGYFQRHANGAAPSVPCWLTELKDHMRQKEHFTAGLPRLLELSGKSQEHTSRSIRKYFGVTPTEWINGFRLQYAANLLQYSEDGIIDISLDCGFENLSHFYHEFKRNYKLSPAKFRASRKKVIIPH